MSIQNNSKLTLIFLAALFLLMWHPVPKTYGNEGWPPSNLISKEDYQANIKAIALNAHQRYTKRLSEESPDSFVYSVFSTIRSHYMTEWIITKGAFSHAVYWVYDLGLPTSIENINMAESVLLMILSHGGYYNRDYIELKDEVKNNPAFNTFTTNTGMGSLIHFDVALALMELEKKDQLIIVPEEMTCPR